MATSFTLTKGDEGRPTSILKVAAFLGRLPLTQSWLITIKRDSPKRSTRQCRYLNGVVYATLGEATGFERDDISEFMCGTHWGWKVVKCPKSPDFPKGFKHVPLRTTTTDEAGNPDTLTAEEFYEYVEFCQRFGAERGIYIADPEPQDLPPWA